MVVSILTGETGREDLDSDERCECCEVCDCCLDSSDDLRVSSTETLLTASRGFIGEDGAGEADTKRGRGTCAASAPHPSM